MAFAPTRVHAYADCRSSHLHVWGGVPKDLPSHVLQHSQEPSRSSSEHSPPPRPLYALLRLYRSRTGLCPLRLLLCRLRRFSRLPAGEQFSTEVIALPFGLFAPTLLFRHPLVQRGLRPFAAGSLGPELFPGLLQVVGRAGALRGLSRL